MGYSQGELDGIQERWKLRFPPDLVELMLERRPLVSNGFDWLTAPDEYIQGRLDWPFDGFMFDVEHNVLWWPEWGPKPETLEQQTKVLREVFAAAPKLIPLFGHRYLPETPFERGNPVFSVYQADVIHYGRTVVDWLAFEEKVPPPAYPRPRALMLKEIPFWTEVIRRNGSLARAQTPVSQP